MFALFFIFIPSDTFCITYSLTCYWKFAIIWTIFFIFSLISTPRITFRTCAIPMTSICPRSCICFESLLTNISKFIVCVNTSYLLVVGDLENSQYIIGGNIWKKKFKISGWLLISIHVREKSEMESGRVDGGGEECTKPWTYTLRHISWDIFPEQRLLCSFTPPPSPLPKLLNNSVSIPSCRPTLRGAGKAVLVFQQICPRV